MTDADFIGAFHKTRLTPKQQYEQRKAERKKLKDMDYQLRQRTEQEMLLDTLDRFVTAAERIADALERR